MKISDVTIRRVLQGVKKSSLRLTVVRKPLYQVAMPAHACVPQGRNGRGREQGHVILPLKSLTLDITYHSHLPPRKKTHQFPTSYKGGWESGLLVCSEDKRFL